MNKTLLILLIAIPILSISAHPLNQYAGIGSVGIHGVNDTKSIHILGDIYFNSGNAFSDYLILSHDNTERREIVFPDKNGTVALLDDVGEGGGGGENNTASNVGTGDGWFKQKVGVNLQFKTITAGSGISITPSSNEIQISATGSGGEANTASNLGIGRQMFKQKSGVDLQFRSLTEGQGISLTENADDVSVKTNFKIDNISQTCSGTDKVSAVTYDNVTGDTIITCSADQSGAGGSGIPLPTTKKYGHVIPSDATPLGVGMMEGATFGGTEAIGADADGVRISTTTGTTAGTDAGVQSANGSICHREWNCYLDARVQTATITTHRLFVGFHSAATLPNSDTTMCDSGSCFGFWTQSGSTIVQNIRNDGDITADETATALTENTAVHRYQVYAKSASNEFCYKIDAAAEVCFSTEIPAATTDLFVLVVLETSDTTSDTFEYYYVYAENDK